MEVRVYATFRPIVGGRLVSVEAECATVRDVLSDLVRQYPALSERVFDEQGGVREYVAIMVGGRDIRHLTGLDTPVSPERELDIFPPVAGGRQ